MRWGKLEDEHNKKKKPIFSFNQAVNKELIKFKRDSKKQKKNRESQESWHKTESSIKEDSPRAWLNNEIKLCVSSAEANGRILFVFLIKVKRIFYIFSERTWKNKLIKKDKQSKK